MSDFFFVKMKTKKRFAWIKDQQAQRHQKRKEEEEAQAPKKIKLEEEVPFGRPLDPVNLQAK